MTRVLIVEDEEAIAELLAINLRHAGFQPQVVDSGEAAQAEVDRVLPDLVLLDWMLPGQSGLQLLRRWRAESRTRDVPVIMLTARGYALDQSELGQTNIRAVLSKPFSPRDVLDKARLALGETPPQVQEALAA